MLKFMDNLSNRKALVKRVENMSGQKSRYMGAPSFAYKVGSYTVARDGTLTVEEADADMEMINAFLQDGTISSGPEPKPNISISLPLDGHTGASLRNLVNLMYSRASLLSKATGGNFGISRGLLEVLDLTATPDSVEEFRAMVDRYAEKYGGIQGFKVADSKIIFSGFGTAQDAAHAKAYTELASRLNQMALTQKRILAREVNAGNEKYAMHIFLIRLGLNGPEFREERKILMERLSGSQAFRTPDQEERAKIKNAQRRKMRKQQDAEGDIANC